MKKIVFGLFSFLLICVSLCGLSAKADSFIDVGTSLEPGDLIYCPTSSGNSMIVLEGAGAVIFDGNSYLLDGDAKDYCVVRDGYVEIISYCDVTSVSGGTWDYYSVNYIYSGTYSLLKNVIFGDLVLTPSQVGVLEFFSLGMCLICLFIPFVILFLVIKLIFRW